LLYFVHTVTKVVGVFVRFRCAASPRHDGQGMTTDAKEMCTILSSVQRSHVVATFCWLGLCQCRHLGPSYVTDAGGPLVGEELLRGIPVQRPSADERSRKTTKTWKRHVDYCCRAHTCCLLQTMGATKKDGWLFCLPELGSSTLPPISEVGISQALDNTKSILLVWLVVVVERGPCYSVS
jgi:hypothetical protein